MLQQISEIGIINTEEENQHEPRNAKKVTFQDLNNPSNTRKETEKETEKERIEK